MKRQYHLLAALLAAALLCGCRTNPAPPLAASSSESFAAPVSAPTAGGQITVTIGGKSFSATLAENETAQAFFALLPLTLAMDELNGNEKYHLLPSGLPAAAQSVGSVRAGDLMLYGTDCVVLFYEDFPTAYRYTRLATLDDPDGLAAAVGTGAVTITLQSQTPLAH